MTSKKIYAFVSAVVLILLLYFEAKCFRSDVKFLPIPHPHGVEKIFRGDNQSTGLGLSSSNEKSKSSKKKVILVYTALFGSREWNHLPEKDAANFTVNQGCKVSNCEITYDNNRLGDSDAVVFHARDMPSPETLRGLSIQSRPLHQRWAYFISENPHNTPNPAPLNGFFNWTMTYKMQSDIWLPYKKYIKIETAEAKPKLIDYATEKNKVHSRKLAIWVVSHCGRLRDQLVKKLQEFISVDVGGACGRNFKNNLGDCKSQNKEGCMEIIKNYKFYFSFENEFCDQYVTEKYWFNALQHDAVPIVFGAGPYNHPKVAIPGSYIDVKDFATVKDLANHLIYLDQNDTAYNEYFAWKQKYKLALDPDWPWADIWGCEICDKLHNDHQTKIYDKLSEFWSVNNDCKDREKKAFDMINNS